ncbi:MAG: TPM domain-containing protein [Candidatus Portnoybacteria bacterium]|nr:TPM domain-containing protein [Candidatus Portnoybacteria bacterium]
MPAPSGFVNDFASILSPEFRASLEQDLQDFEKETDAEIAVATISSLEGEPIEDFAVKLFEEWGIGKKEKNNGVLLLIAKDEREVRLEVGYGLEPYITDGRAGRIIRDEITPHFRNGAYDEGVKEAVGKIKNYILKAEPETRQEAVREQLRETLPLLFATRGGFFFLAFILIYLSSFLARSKSFWLGGVLGGGVGAFLGWLLASLILGAALFFVFGIFGLLLDFLLSRNYQTRKTRGLPLGFWGSGGGFRGGGGFGGFGGGLSGGGGASGRW